MTSPTDVPADQLYRHATGARNRAADYHTHPPGVDDQGWPSQRAYSDAQDSMAHAGVAFAGRQDERGAAVGAAADGFTGQDFDAAKMLQAVGSLVGPMTQAMGSFSQGFAGGLQGMLQGGATALGAMLQGGSALMGQMVGKITPTGSVVPTPPGAAVGGGAAPSVGVPPAAPPKPAETVGHSGPPKDRRDDGGRPVPVIIPAAMGPLAVGTRPPPQRRDDDEPSEPIVKQVVADGH